jgi:hypothetical protein
LVIKPVELKQYPVPGTVPTIDRYQYWYLVIKPVELKHDSFFYSTNIPKNKTS